MYKITHQSQPTATTCMVTCMAMLLNRPVEDFVEWHERLMNYSETGDWLDDILEDEHLSYTYGHPRNLKIYQGNLYLLSVPSLNIPGYLHQVLLDYRDEPILLDPNEGTGRAYYKDIKELGWSIDIKISGKDYDTWRENNE